MVFEGDGMAPYSKWMCFPGHGYLLADTYERPVVLLGPEPWTYPPLRIPPPDVCPPPLCIMFISDAKHFVSFKFKDEAWPAPSIDPCWKSYVQGGCKGWAKLLESHLSLWKKKK